MTHTALLLGAFALSAVFCRKTKALCSNTNYKAGTRRLSECPRASLEARAGWNYRQSSHLAQQTLQLSLEVAVLALERLILAQRHFQAGLQREQILLLLFPGQGRRLAVLYHALLPLGDLRLGARG